MRLQLNADDRAAILDLINQYSYGYDTQDWDLFSSIWADDAVLAAAGAETRTAEGITALARKRREGLAQDGIQTRHYQTNTLLTKHGNDHATGRTMIFVAWQRSGEPTPTPMHTGQYRDEYVRTANGWRIVRRELVVDHD